jgi:hypothetical protein
MRALNIFQWKSFDLDEISGKNFDPKRRFYFILAKPNAIALISIMKPHKKSYMDRIHIKYP